MRRAIRVAATGLLVVCALVAILAVAGRPPAVTPGIRSDALGPDGDEDARAYAARAAGSLEEGDPAAERWALVSFRAPETAGDAAGAVRAVPRVAAAYARLGGITGSAGGAPADAPLLTCPLAEPVDGGRERADTLALALRRAAETGGPGGSETSQTSAHAEETR